MSTIVVVTDLRLLPLEDRWTKLVEPLAAELQSSGLGQIVRLDSLRREATDSGCLELEELAVELKHVGYGWKLIDQLVRAAGIVRTKPSMPNRWLDFHCEEYFSEGWAERGYFDESGQVSLVASIAEVYEDSNLDFLVIGCAGCDGINFGYCRGCVGLWAFYSIDQEFKFMTPTVAELVESWCSGRLSV